MEVADMEGYVRVEVLSFLVLLVHTYKYCVEVPTPDVGVCDTLSTQLPT